MGSDNPFVYGEIVPAEAFVGREAELGRLIDRPRLGPEGLPDLAPPLRQVVARPPGVRRARAAAHVTLEFTVASFSSYVAFLEGYARALVGLESRAGRARSWIRDLFTGGQARDPRRSRRGGRRPRPSPSRRCARRATPPGSPRRSSRCPPGSPPASAAASSSPSTSSRPSPGSTAAASSRRCAPPCSSSGRSATSSPAPSRA